jgi:glycine cleavage system transcriptional repressor
VPELAVTAMGPDQPGIVAAITRVLHDRGGNIEDSAMTILGGNFSLVLLVSTGDDEDSVSLGRALDEAARPLGLGISVREVEGSRTRPAATHLLSVYGSDHPGILAGVAAALAEVGANVTDLSSRLIGSTDEPVYALVVELSTDDEATVRAAVEDAAGELGVDWTLRALDDVTY